MNSSIICIEHIREYTNQNKDLFMKLIESFSHPNGEVLFEDMMEFIKLVSRNDNQMFGSQT